MSTADEVGVLLSDSTSGEQIGFIKFDLSGILMYRSIQPSLHFMAFKPIHRLLSSELIPRPLYEKYALLLDEDKKLPLEVLEREADACAQFLNSLERPLHLGGTVVTARVVYAGDGAE